MTKQALKDIQSSDPVSTYLRLTDKPHTFIFNNKMVPATKLVMTIALPLPTSATGEPM